MPAFLGIASWTRGRRELAAIDSGLMDPSGRGMTQAGMILGIITTVLLFIGGGLVLLTLLVH